MERERKMLNERDGERKRERCLTREMEREKERKMLNERDGEREREKDA